VNRLVVWRVLHGRTVTTNESVRWEAPLGIRCRSCCPICLRAYFEEAR